MSVAIKVLLKLTILPVVLHKRHNLHTQKRIRNFRNKIIPIPTLAYGESY